MTASQLLRAMRRENPQLKLSDRASVTLYHKVAGVAATKRREISRRRAVARGRFQKLARRVARFDRKVSLFKTKSKFELNRKQRLRKWHQLVEGAVIVRRDHVVREVNRHVLQIYSRQLLKRIVVEITKPPPPPPTPVVLSPCRAMVLVRPQGYRYPVTCNNTFTEFQGRTSPDEAAALQVAREFRSRMDRNSRLAKWDKFIQTVHINGIIQYR